MKTIETTVYDFDELSASAQDKARNWYREASCGDSFWSENVIDDAKAIGALMGICIRDVYFSGFSSQGDGACFVGNYSYAKGSVAAVKAYAPKDTEMHRLAQELASIQRVNFYGVSARISHGGHYNHSGCMFAAVYDTNGDDCKSETDDAVTNALRSFANWIYSQLEAEYDYKNSDGQVDESIRANDYTFTEDGARF